MCLGRWCFEGSGERWVPAGQAAWQTSCISLSGTRLSSKPRFLPTLSTVFSVYLCKSGIRRAGLASCFCCVSIELGWGWWVETVVGGPLAVARREHGDRETSGPFSVAMSELRGCGRAQPAPRQRPLTLTHSLSHWRVAQRPAAPWGQPPPSFREHVGIRIECCGARPTDLGSPSRSRQRPAARPRKGQSSPRHAGSPDPRAAATSETAAPPSLCQPEEVCAGAKVFLKGSWNWVWLFSKKGR